METQQKSGRAPPPGHIDLPDPHSTHESDDLPSPLDMRPGQIDGLESIQQARLARQGGQSPRSEGSSLMHLKIPGYSTAADLALVAMQYLPIPLIVLNNLKTVVMANEAMGRLMALEDSDENDNMSDDGLATDKLRGKTLSQIGIDVIQDGRYAAPLGLLLFLIFTFWL